MLNEHEFYVLCFYLLSVLVTYTMCIFNVLVCTYLENMQQHEIRNHLNYHKSERFPNRTGNNMKSERTTLTSLGVNIGKSDRQQQEIRNHINYHKSERFPNRTLTSLGVNIGKLNRQQQEIRNQNSGLFTQNNQKLNSVLFTQNNQKLNSGIY